LEEKKIILVYKRNAVLAAVKTKKKRIKSRITGLKKLKK